MSTNGVNTVEEADMSECDGEKVVTMMDVLQEQQDFEEDANAVLGASDDKNCTFSKGYIKRQAVYACLTCCGEAKHEPTKRAGVCLACSLNCHENHELIELYTKRNFRCDCGNPKFNSHPCTFTPNKKDLNEDNMYNQNFSGLYCTCHRPYPDPESSVEDEMIQCIICEDWLHASHLEATIPANELYSEMICKSCMDNNEFLHDYSNFAVNVESADVDILTVNGTDICVVDKITCNGDLDKDRYINGTKVSESSKEIEANNSMEVDSSEDVLQGSENTNKVDTADSNNKMITTDEVANTNKDKQEVTQTEITNQELPTVEDSTGNEVNNTDPKASSSASIDSANAALPSNDLENTPKEFTNLPIEAEESEKNETIEHMAAEQENTETTMTNNMDSKISQNVPNSNDTIDVPESEDKEVSDNPENSVTDKTAEPISEENIDLMKEIPKFDKGNLEAEKNTNNEEETEIQKHSEQMDAIEDAQPRESDHNISSTEEDQTKSSGPSDTNTLHIDNSLEDNVDKSIADPSPKIEKEGEHGTFSDAISEQNLLETEHMKEPVDETDRSETHEMNKNKIEEQNHNIKQDNSKIESVEKIQDSELINDAKENTDTDNQTSESNDTEINNCDKENLNEHLSDKIEDAKMDVITNKTENSNNESELTDKVELLNTTETKSDKSNDCISECVLNKKDKNDMCNNIESESNSVTIGNDVEISDSTRIEEPTSTNTEHKVPSETITSEDNIKENKRKLSIEDAEDVFVKKPKLEETTKCVRPQGVKKVYKGATFWPSNFRQKLCTCNECISMYKDLAVLYLIDLEDTVFAYETLGKEKTDGNPATQYEKGLQALSSLDRIQQINALTEYNKMRDKLLDFLKSFKDRKEIVKEEDIKAFFAGMKPKKEPDGVYFCR